jgi:NAD(P)-dependent dehydrogenase (short-subunit alcohol dehydrogenase family)
MNKLALITGGAKRLGRTVAEALADVGYDCLIHANTSQSEAHSLCLELRAKGIRAEYCLHAIDDPATAAEFLLNESMRHFGQLPSCSVLSAASYKKDDPKGRQLLQVADQLDVNFLFPVAFCAALAARIEPPSGKVTGDCSVILFTDYKVQKINPDYFSYSIAKHALDGVLPFLTVSYAKKIRVNAIAPGPISSHDMSAEDLAELVKAASISQKYPTMEEIGMTAAFLAQNRALYGQHIFVDAGARYEANARELSLGDKN